MHSDKKVFGVDVLLDDDDNEKEERPYCMHGPTVLFEKFVKDEPSLKYYACAACRERKECNFYQIKGDRLTEGKKLLQKEIKKELSRKAIPRAKLSINNTWCLDCSATAENKHDNHRTRQLSKEDFSQATFLLQPKSNKKTNAQYFFTEDACNLFLVLIKKLCLKKIICIGTPRLFEKILPLDDSKAFLLDIDDRFQYFYEDNMFTQYNMFNHYFFERERGENKLKNFLEGSDPEEILIVIDPPFGGLASLLADSLKKIRRLCITKNKSAEISTILVFPYFLESHVNLAIPELKMMDFKVSYTNHNIYNNETKKGSPVRLFTNISPEKFSLPKDNYRFCKLCGRYVSKENRHCEKCEACTSKDGRTYIHCNQCSKCVKPGLNHCETCHSCQQPHHVCNTNMTKAGCHICGDNNHKRRDCPKKFDAKKKSSHKRKRKSETTECDGKICSKRKLTKQKE